MSSLSREYTAVRNWASGVPASSKARHTARAASPRPPSEYVRGLYFDALTHDPDALRFLVHRVGSERVLLGTDYPFALGEARPGETIGRLEEVPEDDRAGLLGRNCLAFFGLA